MKKFLFYLAAFSLSHSSLMAFKTNSMKLSQASDPKIAVNNRILARINGKSISAYDVMKKMDMDFFRQYPQYVSSIEARYQYYQFSWKPVLDELINKELILADAQENKVEVSNGDVRQEMESLFGPNVIANLDKLNINFDEGFKIVQGDIIIRKMIGGRVNTKALRAVTPVKVKKAYEEYIKNEENSRLSIWDYAVVTIKDRDLDKSEVLSKKIYQMLMHGTSLDKLVQEAKENKLIGRKAKLTVSNTIRNNEKELSSAYKNVLTDLEPGMYSQPFPHKSRADHTTVYRIVFLKEKIPGGFPPFKEIENTLKEQMLNEIAERETEAYITRLRHHYHFKDEELESMVPAGYQPFEQR